MNHHREEEWNQQNRRLTSVAVAITVVNQVSVNEKNQRKKTSVSAAWECPFVAWDAAAMTDCCGRSSNQEEQEETVSCNTRQQQNELARWLVPPAGHVTRVAVGKKSWRSWTIPLPGLLESCVFYIFFHFFSYLPIRFTSFRLLVRSEPLDGSAGRSLTGH